MENSHSSAIYSRNCTNIKRIYVWENGDFSGNGQIFVINRKHYRTWSCILGFLTNILRPSFGAVRYVINLKNNEYVKSFESLESNGKYIVTGHEKLKSPNTKNCYKTIKEKRELDEGKPNANKIIKAINNNNQQISLFVLPNGKTAEIPRKVILSSNNLLQSWNLMLDLIARKLNIPIGIQFLFNLSGNVVQNPQSLKNGNMYIAVPSNEEFIKLDYMSIFKNLQHMEFTAKIPNKINDPIIVNVMHNQTNKSKYETQKLNNSSGRINNPKIEPSRKTTETYILCPMAKKNQPEKAKNGESSSKMNKNSEQCRSCSKVTQNSSTNNNKSPDSRPVIKQNNAEYNSFKKNEPKKNSSVKIQERSLVTRPINKQVNDPNKNTTQKKVQKENPEVLIFNYDGKSSARSKTSQQNKEITACSLNDCQFKPLAKNQICRQDEVVEKNNVAPRKKSNKQSESSILMLHDENCLCKDCQEKSSMGKNSNVGCFSCCLSKGNKSAKKKPEIKTCPHCHECFEENSNLPIETPISAAAATRQLNPKEIQNAEKLQQNVEMIECPMKQLNKKSQSKTKQAKASGPELLERDDNDGFCPFEECTSCPALANYKNKKITKSKKKLVTKPTVIVDKPKKSCGTYPVPELMQTFQDKSIETTKNKPQVANKSCSCDFHEDKCCAFNLAWQTQKNQKEPSQRKIQIAEYPIDAKIEKESMEKAPSLPKQPISSSEMDEIYSEKIYSGANVTEIIENSVQTLPRSIEGCSSKTAELPENKPPSREISLEKKSAEKFVDSLSRNLPSNQELMVESAENEEEFTAEESTQYPIISIEKIPSVINQKVDDEVLPSKSLPQTYCEKSCQKNFEEIFKILNRSTNNKDLLQQNDDIKKTETIMQCPNKNASLKLKEFVCPKCEKKYYVQSNKETPVDVLYQNNSKEKQKKAKCVSEDVVENVVIQTPSEFIRHVIAQSIVVIEMFKMTPKGQNPQQTNKNNKNVCPARNAEDEPAECEKELLDEFSYSITNVSLEESNYQKCKNKDEKIPCVTTTEYSDNNVDFPDIFEITARSTSSIKTNNNKNICSARNVEDKPTECEKELVLASLSDSIPNLSTEEPKESNYQTFESKEEKDKAQKGPCVTTTEYAESNVDFPDIFEITTDNAEADVISLSPIMEATIVESPLSIHPTHKHNKVSMFSDLPTVYSYETGSIVLEEDTPISTIIFEQNQPEIESTFQSTITALNVENHLGTKNRLPTKQKCFCKEKTCKCNFNCLGQYLNTKNNNNSSSNIDLKKSSSIIEKSLTGLIIGVGEDSRLFEGVFPLGSQESFDEGDDEGLLALIEPRVSHRMNKHDSVLTVRSNNEINK